MREKTELQIEQDKSVRYRNNLNRALVLLGTMVLDETDIFHKLVVHEFLARVRVQLEGMDKLVNRNKI